MGVSFARSRVGSARIMAQPSRPRRHAASTARLAVKRMGRLVPASIAVELFAFASLASVTARAVRRAARRACGVVPSRTRSMVRR